MMTNRNIEQQGRALLRESVRQIRRAETTKARRISAGSLAMLMAGVQIMPAFAAITNTVTANGTGPGGAPVSSTSSASVGVQAAAPAVTIVKSATLVDGVGGVAGKGDVGETINYTYKVKNTGNVTLKNVAINDVSDGVNPAGLAFGTPSLTDAAPLLDSTNASAVKTKWDILAPGDAVTFSSSYVIVQGDINASGGGTTVGAHVEPDGKLDNTVTVAADYINTTAGTTTVVNATDHAAVPLDVAPGLQVSKSASPSSNVKVGDLVTYTYTVTNNGNTDITNIALTDTFKGVVGGITPAFSSFTTNPGNLSTRTGNTINVLKPGSVAVYTATYTVTQSDVDAQ